MLRFKSFKGKITIGGKSITYRVSVQPIPDPPAVVLSTDVNPAIVCIALGDWPEIVSTVESLKQEAGV